MKTESEPKYGRVGNYHEGVAWAIIETGMGFTGEVDAQVINEKEEVLLDGDCRYYNVIDCNEGIIGLMTDAQCYIDYYDLTGKYIVGSKKVTAGEKQIELDVVPQILNSRTLVPARALAESLHAKVDWDSEGQTVIIEKE